MSNSQSGGEIRAKYIAAMGNDLGEVFTVLSNEMSLLCWQFDELSELYGGAPARVELMNRVAPFFFWLLQRTWMDETLLGITRLVAPLKSAGQENLTLKQLPALVSDSHLSAQLGRMFDDVLVHAAFARERRNKRIAHLDRAQSLNQAAPLPAAQLEEIARVLDEMAEILNAVDLHYCRATTIYRNAPITHGVRSLLYAARDGVRFEDARQKRLEQGEIRPEDWHDGAPAL